MITRLEPAPAQLVAEAGLPAAVSLFLKREDEHELGAFKWRGALPTVEGYRYVGARTVVTASTGNHGAATAWACTRLGLGCVPCVELRRGTGTQNTVSLAQVCFFFSFWPQFSGETSLLFIGLLCTV